MPEGTSAFLPWRHACLQKPAEERRFEEWLFSNASTVLLGQKPAELLNLTLTEHDLTVTATQARLAELSRLWNIDFLILHATPSSVQFLAYRPARVQEILDQTPRQVASDQLGYRCPLRVDNFLGEIRERWARDNAIPHEIGITLGYPLEDVFGYMGLWPLRCKGACGWQVYGCLDRSRELSKCFQNARCCALIFLASTATEKSRLSNQSTGG